MVEFILDAQFFFGKLQAGFVAFADVAVRQPFVKLGGGEDAQQVVAAGAFAVAVLRVEAFDGLFVFAAQAAQCDRRSWRMSQLGWKSWMLRAAAGRKGWPHSRPDTAAARKKRRCLALNTLFFLGFVVGRLERWEIYGSGL